MRLFLFEQNFVAHGQKMKIDCSFLNKTLWLMDNKMKIDLSFLNKTLWLMEGTSHG